MNSTFGGHIVAFTSANQFKASEAADRFGFILSPFYHIPQDKSEPVLGWKFFLGDTNLIGALQQALENRLELADRIAGVTVYVLKSNASVELRDLVPHLGLTLADIHRLYPNLADIPHFRQT